MIQSLLASRPRYLGLVVLHILVSSLATALDKGGAYSGLGFHGRALQRLSRNVVEHGVSWCYYLHFE